MRKFYFVSLLFFLCSLTVNSQTYHQLSGGAYLQNWSSTGSLLTTNDDWTNVPNVRGFLGQDITTATGANPQSLLAVSAVANDIDLIANQTNPNISNGGVAEFEITDPVIALQGSGTADAPYIVLYMNSTGVTNVRVKYNLRDIDASTDNSVQPVALQYRIGNSGNFTNVPSGFVTDASSGPSLATLVTAVDVTLPAACDNQPMLEIRIITSNAVGNDEWIGIDDIDVSGSSTPGNTVSVAAGTNAAEPSTAGSFTINFSAPTTAPTDVNFSYAGTASFGSDYTVSYSTGSTTSTTATGTLSVPAGVSSVTVTVTPIDDNIVEGTESISLDLSSPGGGYSIGGSGTTSITLTDNDITATVSVAAGTNAAEPSTNGTFNLTLSVPAPAGGITVTYSLAGTASTSDYNDALSGTITIAAGSNTGTITLIPIDDLNFEGTETITINLTSASNGVSIATATASINLLDNDNPPAANVVINQLYGGGGNSGSTYKNDFIELFNNENTPVNLSGWSVQYSSAGGTGTWTVTPLTGTIPAHGFFLVQEAAGAGGTTSLPAPDVTGTIAMSAAAGKVILSNSPAAQTGANPSGVNVMDKVGYGGATGFETAPTPVTDNSTGVQRVADGVDNNNNSTDFVVAAPIPRNSTYTTTGPVVVTLSPPNNSTDVPYNVVPTISFDKPIQKGTGSITIYEDGVAGTPIDVTSPAIVISSNRIVTINTTLNGGKTYAIQITAGAFEDVYGNDFPGITNNSTWTFTTFNSSVATALPANFDFQNCTGSGLLPHGFTQYSVGGAITWDCTPFGRDPAAPNGTAAFPNAVQMNGFANGTNIPNIDWLISPAIDLTGTTFPLLSFWSRTAFNGASLQLKISTDYTGGNPLSATWTDLNGKFPALASNVWTLSSDINLSAFKQPNVHFAFVYTSTDEEGARWTLDDISVINSATPPPPSLTVGTNDIQYSYVASGSTADKTFTFIGNDLTNDVTVVSAGDFLVSKDGTTFSNSITYTVAEANNVNEAVYVRFAPSQANQNFTGTVTVTTGSLSSTINLKGTSIDPATTLEIVNWNMEWFGSTDPTLGPTNDNLQEQNAATILTTVQADLFALVEVVDESRLANIVSQMPGYSYVICNYGSHTNTNESGASPLSGAQKEAFVYKTSMFSNITTTPLLSQGTNSTADLSNPAYNWWSSGRFPFLMSADVTLNCVTKNVKFVLVHAKANTSPTATAYDRRKRGADTLYYTLNQLFPNDNIVILGDFNDDLDQSITAGFTTTSWNSFTNDPSNFTALTLPLSLAGKKSTTGFNDMIDHVIVSNEMAPYYMNGTANVLNDVTSLVSNYSSTTSDHFPVFTRYKFELPPPPTIACPENIVKNNDPGVCGATVTYTLNVSSSCGEPVIQQTQGFASGSVFPVGTTTNTFIVKDAAGGTATCSFTVTVTDNENPTISCPGNVVRNTDAGSCGAVVNYTVNYADNCTGATLQQTSGLASGATFPSGVTTNTFVVTDAAGHTSTCSFTVTVTDNIAPTFTKPANKTIPFIGTCGYDASVAQTGDVTNENDNCSTGLQATYTDQVTYCGNIITINRSWKLVDNSGNQAPVQVQVITVSDNSTPYIVYATKEARFGEFNLINGSVGVTSSTGVADFKRGTILNSPDFVKAKNITAEPLTFIPNRISVAANDGPAPAFFAFSGNVAGLTTRTITSSTATPVSANYKELRIKKNVSVTVTGTLYGKIIIEEGAQVTFTPSGGIINIENLEIDGSAVNMTRIKFGACTSVRMRNEVEIGKYVLMNMDGPKVTFYLGDNTTDDENFIIDDGFNVIAVNIYIPKGELRIKDNSDLVAMKGWYIVERLNSKGKYMVWDDNDCSPSSSPMSRTPELITKQTVNEPGSLVLKASPNPSTDQFTIRIESNSPEPVTLRITDVSGKVINVKPGITPNTTIKAGMDLKNGVYFAEAVQGGETKVVKLIKL